MPLFSVKKIFHRMDVGILAFVVVGCARDPGLQPSIALQDRVIDAGRVTQGEVIERDLGFSNRGSGTLKIARITTDCYCTATLLSGRETGLGQNGTVVVRVDTSALSGPIARVIRLETNDPRHRSVSVSITGTVIPEFSVSDGVVNFGDVPDDDEAVRAIYVSYSGNVRILDASSSDETVTVSLEEASATVDDRATIKVIRKRNVRRGAHFGNILIRTSSARMPELRVPVRGTVTGR